MSFLKVYFYASLSLYLVTHVIRIMDYMYAVFATGSELNDMRSY